MNNANKILISKMFNEILQMTMVTGGGLAHSKIISIEHSELQQTECEI